MKPVIGNWYKIKDDDQSFEIIDIDEETGSIEVQYFDGTVEEMDLDGWEEDVDDGIITKQDSPDDWTSAEKERMESEDPDDMREEE